MNSEPRMIKFRDKYTSAFGIQHSIFDIRSEEESR
jgi:hypothetical protein